MQFGKKRYHPFLSLKTFYGIVAFLIINSLLLFKTQAAQSRLTDDIVPNFYEQGLEEKSRGNFKRSLAIWEKAITKLKEPDFRISQSYIELVVDQEIKQKYQKASKIYSWGLTGKLEEREREHILKEISYLRYMIRNRDYKDLKRAAENVHSNVLINIANFWTGIDPTPLSTYNERLLEHWERISYAQKNYTKKNSKELDDRAFIYIKYGEPYYRKQGQLNYMSSFVTRLLKEGVQTPSFGSANDIAASEAQRRTMENRVRQYHTYPRYEVWIYRRLTNELQNTIFLFGTRDGTSSFRKINSIDDFIPSEAYRTLSQHNYSISRSSPPGQQNRSDVEVATRPTGNNIPTVEFSAALILQLMYYEQFAALDAHFGKAYNEMMDRFVSTANTSSSNRGLAREFGTLYGTKLIHIQNRAPAEQSEYEAEIIDLPSEIYSYRFLDRKDTPYLKVFSVSQFEEALYYDLLKKTNSLQTNIADRYTLLSGYQVRDESGKPLFEKKSSANIRSLGKIVNVYDIPHQENSESKSILISHELHNIDTQNDSLLSAESVYPKSLKGLTKHELTFPESLDRNKLVLSDIIVGYSSEERKQATTSSNSRDSLNFTIAHDKGIPQGTDLNLYYELYNLEPKGSNEIAEYTLQYSIKEKRKGFLKLGKPGDDQITITINNTVTSNRDQNTIIINTSDYPKGDYELNIEITDINSGLTYATLQNFSVQ